LPLNCLFSQGYSSDLALGEKQQLLLVDGIGARIQAIPVCTRLIGRERAAIGKAE
jgi:hypothetical protein